MYTNLNDAAENTGNPAYAKGGTTIWYMKPEVFRDFSMGAEFLREHPQYGTLPESAAQLPLTHVALGSISETNLDAIFTLMQGEAWSPRGEARNLIQGKGLRHTSMSVGDIIQIGKHIWMVDREGHSCLTARSGGKRRHGRHVTFIPGRPRKRQSGGGVQWPPIPASKAHFCGCENTACHHGPEGCQNPVGQARAAYVGPVCNHCAKGLSEYLLVTPEGRKTWRAREEEQEAARFKYSGRSSGKRRHGVLAPAQGKCSRCGKPMLWSKAVTGWDPKQEKVTLMHSRCARGIGKYPAKTGSIERLAGDVGRMLKR